MRKITFAIIGFLLLSLSITACNLPSADNISNTSSGNEVLTLAAETAIAQLTLSAHTAPTNTTFLIPTNPPTNTPEPTEEVVPCNRALFITDVTVEDGSEFNPGENFEKVWRMKNTGSCTWTRFYSLVFESGDMLGGDAIVALLDDVPPGSQIDISLALTAPNSAGSYKGTWQMRGADGIIFTTGGMWADIIVTDNTPEAYTAKASLSIEQTYLAELDEGISTGNSADSDFEFDLLSDDNKFLEPRNGASFSYIGTDQPTYQQCKTETLSDGNIEINTDLIGKWLCYQTNVGRYGRMKVTSLEPAGITTSQVLEISFTTWQFP